MSKDAKIMCFSCHEPPTCTAAYKIKGLSKEQEISYPDKSTTAESITLLTDSRGNDVTSVLIPKPKCLSGKIDCPKTTITQIHLDSRHEVITELSPAKLSDIYKIKYDGTKFLRELDPWEWLELAFKTDPSDIRYQKYISTTSDCSGIVQQTNIKAFPKLKISGELSIGTTIDAATIRNLGKRNTYSKKQVIEFQKKAQTTKWSQISKYLCDKEYKVLFKSTVSVGHEKKSSSFTPFTKKATDFSNKNSPVHKLSRILKKLGEKAMSGSGSGIIKDLTIIPPQLAICGEKKLKVTDNTPYYDYNYSLKLAPLVGVVALVDVIDVLLSLLASPGAGIAWRKLRNRLEEMKNATESDQKKYGWYGIFYIDFIISGNVLQGEGALTSINHQKSFNGKAGNEIGLKIIAGVEAGAQVLWVKGQMIAETDSSSAIRSNLVADHKGVGVQFEHEGIRSHFSFTFKAEKLNKTSKNSNLTTRHNHKARKKASSYEILNTDVVWAEKDCFGPYYFIDN